MIYVVGLGPGSTHRLPPQAFVLLTGSLPVFFRTARHPVLQSGQVANALAGRADVFSLDDEYESNASFDDTYAAIVVRVLREHNARGAIVYAVPGHPLLGESTVARLLPEAKKRGVPVEIVGAPSFIDACLEAVGEAVTGNLTVVDALTLSPNAPPSALLRGGKNGPLLLYQVYDREAASQAKLALMRAGYPDDFLVTLVCAAGIDTQETVVRNVPLFELDRTPALLHHLTSVWVPPISSEDLKPDFYDLVQVMARLRDGETGCPWDLKQTHQSLRPYVLEEAYEVADAIDDLDSANDGMEKLADELGDLLLQVVFHAQIAGETGDFDESDVCAAIVSKLIRRHPHIFGDVSVANADEVLTNWNAIKAAEKNHEDRTSVLSGVSHSAPALFQAWHISQKAVKAGFEWPDTGGVLNKAEEEFAELRAEIEAGNPDKTRISAELGDLLFTIVNVARRFEIDPENALRQQIARFSRRFEHIEAGAKAQNRPIETLTLLEMEAFWQEAKQIEKATIHS